MNNAERQYLETNLITEKKMYVKIEKDYSDNFLLIEAKEVDMRCVSFNMTLSNYVSGLVIPLFKDDTLPERQMLSKEAMEKLSCMFPKYFIWDNIRPVSEHCNQICVDECDCNLTIKGVIADGIGYVTSGRIYILNDKGQTIQKI